MKRAQILLAIILLLLAFFSACQDDLPVVEPEEETSASLFMTKSAFDLDENLLLIQAAMQRVDSVTPFFERFTQLYGTPLWQYALPMGEEESDISYLVPVYKEEIPNIIHTIWFFDIRGDTLRYRTITRDNEHIRTYHQDFVFDELSYNIFGDESAGELKFEAPPQTRAWGKEYYDCHYAVIEWGDIQIYGELYCKERTVWVSETVDSTDNNPIIGGETGLGGGGGVTPPGSSQGQITQANLSQKIPDIKKRMKDLACGIDDVDIVYKPGECTGNAMVKIDEETGKMTIYVGGKFFTHEYQDQISIIYHEAYHYKNDVALSSNDIMHLDSPHYLNIPPEHMDYLKNYQYEGVTTPDFFINEYDAKIEYLFCPEYYKNEINTYDAEMRMIPSVSKKYNLERSFMLWKQDALYNYSLQHYKL